MRKRQCARAWRGLQLALAAWLMLGMPALSLAHTSEIKLPQLKPGTVDALGRPWVMTSSNTELERFFRRIVAERLADQAETVAYGQAGLPRASIQLGTKIELP